MFNVLKRDLSYLERISAQTGNSSVLLWESFRDHAYLWRGLSILLFPITLVALVGVVIMYLTADTMIEVPPKRAPQYYRVDQLPDRPFIDMGKEIITLLSSYTAERAQEQFVQVRGYLWEPALSAFDQEVMDTELKTIRDTRRTQLFVIDPKMIQVDRSDEDLGVVTVRVPGTRQKLIGGQLVPTDAAAYFLKLSTVPRNSLNEFGIVAVDIRIRVVASLMLLAEEDRKQASEKKRMDRRKRQGMAQGRSVAR